MPKTGNAKSLKQRIAKFRLTSAGAILCNPVHTARRQGDMHDKSHMAELCEQYSLLLLLNALATEYGFPVCTQSMHPDKLETKLPLLSWASLVDRYPLQIYGDSGTVNVKMSAPGIAAPIESLYGELELAMSNLQPLTPELVAALYQQTISAPLSIDDDATPHIDLGSDQRIGGEFYTPAWVADYAMEEWLRVGTVALVKGLEGNDSYPLPRILDPSSGSGNFLLAAVRLADRLELSPARQLEFCGNSLYGRDIDGRAVQLSKLLILILLAKQFQTMPQAEIAKALERLCLQLDCNLQINDSMLASLVDKDESRFDLVITNPPYISFGSRDQQQISMQWQKLLKRRFPASSEYKVRYTSIFQEIGIELSRKSKLKPVTEDQLDETAVSFKKRASQCSRLHRGQCIYLVPDAFLTGSYYQKLRRLILDQVEIVGLSELPASTIADATVGRWCLAHYKERQSNDLILPDAQAEDLSTSTVSSPVVKMSSLFCGAAGAVRCQFEMPLLAMVSKDRDRFQMVFSKEDLEILLLCRELGFLGEALSGHTGIRSRIGQKSIIAASEISQSHSPGLVSGAELRPFKIDWKGNWLNLFPENLFAGGFDREVIAGPKILLRQTGDCLVAAVDTSGLYHLNNIHSFVPLSIESRKRQIYFYCCLLNSAFYLYFYRMKTREHKRALAQIDIETVEHMPLAPRNKPIESDLESLGRSLQGKLVTDMSKDLAMMDQLVFDLFGLNREMQRHVAKVVNESASPKRLQPVLS